MDSVVALLREIVAIDSVNPSLVPGGAGEAAIADRLAGQFRHAHIDVALQEAAPGRPNVIAVVAGRSPGRTLMLCGHTDTVGVAGMTDPLTPVERDGRLYGRGAQDMKGGVAAMVDAAVRVAADGGLERGRLVVACVADEEHASVGAEALVREHRADAAVVTEPTDLQVAVAHKGFTWVRIETKGRAAHGSRPAEGRDAIFAMGRVASALDAIDRQLEAGARHPLLGPASLHAATVHGGREWSTYPDQCVLEVERRTLPGEPPGVALAEVERVLDAIRARDSAFDARAAEVFGRAPYEIDARAELPQALARIARSAGHPAPVVGMSFWTDAAILGAAGIPSVLFGPGGAGLHGIEEYVTVAEVIACRDILVRLAREFC